MNTTALQEVMNNDTLQYEGELGSRQILCSYLTKQAINLTRETNHRYRIWAPLLKSQEVSRLHFEHQPIEDHLASILLKNMGTDSEKIIRTENAFMQL